MFIETGFLKPTTLNTLTFAFNMALPYQYVLWNKLCWCALHDDFESFIDSKNNLKIYCRNSIFVCMSICTATDQQNPQK